jgi:Rne/Rng family ribonuclease
VRSRARTADAPKESARAEKPADKPAAKPKPRRSKKSTRPAAKQMRKKSGQGEGRSQAKAKAKEEAAPDEAGTKDAPTRLQARRQRGSQSAGGRTATKEGPAGSRRGRAGGQRSPRRPVGAVDEETRRAIAGGPPRRMLVSVGEERTQIAVLEERSLVEHFVTRKSDVSYVGNIYLGRVQNVLPGMEAAFLDIGKGRNGVLYAGEVDYEDTDFEGELPRIEQALKPGQTVLVQVTKDPMGSKGARLTQRLSIAGRYCVLAPGDGMLGISRKLPDEERDRLRKILKDIKPDGFGLIVRTAAEEATREQLEADVARLERIWSEVTDRAEKAKPLDTVYEEPTLVIRVIRDVFGPEYTGLIVDSAELADQVRDYLTDVAPDLVERVSVHSGDDSLFDAYEVTTQIRRALEKKVWLASGGYLIIEKTEAMWVIDVNTGKFVGQDNLEETVLRNNLEAAEEIARQLRLRDMGGIIVIDFVDMLVPANRDEVLKRFRRELARDKTKSRVMEISKLGLVQMTRKNVSQGLTEVYTKTCDVCEGRGAQILDSAFQ